MMTMVVPFLRQMLVIGLGAALLTPFVYTNSTTFPFVFGKVIALRILVEILLAVWVALLLLDPESRPKKSQVLTALLFWMGALGLSTIFAVDSYRAFWGGHERMGGLFSILHAFALAPMAATAFRTERAWQRFWTWGLITANLMAALGLVQYFSPNNFLLTRGGGRIWATLGNYIYLGQYALFFSILAFGLAAFAESKKVRAFAFATGLLQIVIMLLTETRGVLIGFVCAVAFLVVWFIWKGSGTGSHRRRWFLIGSGALLALLLAFFFFGDRSKAANTVPGLRRLTYRELSTAAGGTSTRLIAWRIALEAWSARPIFGFGPENFSIAFNRFYHPESLRFSFYETWFDRAHNGHLDILAMNGIVGVIAAIYLYYAIIRTLFRSARDEPGNKLRAGFALALFASYLAQLTFVFDSATSLVLISLFYGWVMRIGWGDAAAAPAIASKKPDGIRTAIAALGGVTALVLIFAANVQPLRANQRALHAAAFVQVRGDLISALGKNREARAIWSPYQRDVRLDFGRDVSQRFGNSTAVPLELRDVWLQAVNGLEENIRRWPTDVYEYILLAQLYNQGSNLDPQAFQKAEALLEKAIPLSPKRQQLFFTLGKTKLLLRKQDEAIELLKRAVEFDDRVGEAHLYYALALSDSGRREEAYRELTIALERGYQWNTPVEMLFAADLAIEIKDYPAAYRFLSNASGTYAGIAEFQARFAEAAFLSGDVSTAKALAEKAVALDGSFRERLKKILQ